MLKTMPKETPTCSRDISSEFICCLLNVIPFPSEYLMAWLNLFMQDKKILNEFAAKITKAKILHDSTQATCQKLRREVAQL